jgi:hypothetical protein
LRIVVSKTQSQNQGRPDRAPFNRGLRISPTFPANLNGLICIAGG